MEFFHSEQKGERTQSAPSSLQCAEQLQSHSAKSIQTQSRSTPQKGIVIPYKCYTTYKPNKRAQADLSAHRPDGLRLRGGNRAKLNNIFIYHNICQEANLQNVVFTVRGRIFTMPYYIFRVYYTKGYLHLHRRRPPQ